MQLTGDRFTNATAILGNDLATLAGLPGRDPGAGRHGATAYPPSRSSSPAATSPPRGPCRRLGGHEPGGAQSRPGQGGAGRNRHHQRGFVHPAQPREGGVRVRPDDRWDAGRLPGLPGADDVDHRSGRREPRGRQEGSRAVEEHVRPRIGLVDVRASRRRHAPVVGERSSAASPRSTRPTSHRSTPATTSARRPSSSRIRSDVAAAPVIEGPTGTSRARRRWRGASSRRRSAAVCRCSTPAIRSRPHPTSCTSCRSTRTSAS